MLPDAAGAAAAAAVAAAAASSLDEEVEQVGFGWDAPVRLDFFICIPAAVHFLW